MEKIILTDWPKVERINANLRGVTTEKLLEIRDQMFHLMMGTHAEEAGGYVIFYDCEKLDDELKFRGVEREIL